eukprot:6351427-Prymnesium_polylepis.1
MATTTLLKSVLDAVKDAALSYEYELPNGERFTRNTYGPIVKIFHVIAYWAAGRKQAGEERQAQTNEMKAAAESVLAVNDLSKMMGWALQPLQEGKAPRFVA